MNVVKKYSVKTNADTIFIKVDMKNHFKINNCHYEDFLIFVFMELSTNLVKYGGGGYLWLMEKDDKYALACFDNGDGIKDLGLATTDGYTTSTNSLGLGLHQIAQNSDFDMQIYTQTNEIDGGTVVLVSQKGINEDIVFITKAYMGLEQNGDYFTKKGKNLIFGDASGHGIKAQKSADSIKNFFMDNFLSLTLVKSFLDSLDKHIKTNHLRSTVICLIQKKKNNVEVCGVGNLDMWIQDENKYHRKTLKDGIVGEVFSNISSDKFELSKNQKLILNTDGLEPIRVKDFLDALKHNYSSLMLSLCMLHFLSSQMDDSSILIIEGV